MNRQFPEKETQIAFKIEHHCGSLPAPLSPPPLPPLAHVLYYCSQQRWEVPNYIWEICLDKAEI